MKAATIDQAEPTHDTSRVNPIPHKRAVAAAAVKNILLPVDFSTTSLKSLGYGAALAARARGVFEALHVLEPGITVADLNGMMCPNLPDEVIAAELRSQLATLASRHASPGQSFTSEVRIGDPIQEIISAASSSHSDLIVIGTHGRTGFNRMLFGSVADRVIRDAPCPVLVIRETPGDVASPPESSPPLMLEKILVLTDLSPRSMDAFHYAVDLADQFNAKVTLAHFLPNFDAAGMSECVPSELSKSIQAVREAATRRLADALRDCAHSKVVAEPAVIRGSLLAEIPAFARVGCFDLIVCTTHGFSGFQHALFGSTAEALLRQAPCPVLVVRTPFPRPSE